MPTSLIAKSFASVPHGLFDVSEWKLSQDVHGCLTISFREFHPLSRQNGRVALSRRVHWRKVGRG